MLGRIWDRLLSGMAVLAGLLLLFMTFSISYSIFTRFFGIQSPVWTVQFNEYALLWMTFLGSAWALRRRKHVSMDIITGRLRPKTLKVMERIHSVIGIGLCAVLCWFGGAMTLNFYRRGVTDVQAVDMPKALLIMVIPIGLFLLCIQFARNLGTASAKADTGDKVAAANPGLHESPGHESTREASKGRDR